MKTLETTTYKSKDKFWVDENGVSIPYNRTTKAERKTERYSGSLLKRAVSLNTQLTEFKEQVAHMCEEISKAVTDQLKSGKPHKGNFTFFNFDRSIKISVNVSERIDFDDITIAAAKEKLDSFLNEKLQGDHMVKQLVMDAFAKSGGKLDAKKVMSLLRYRERVNDPRFSEALDLIEKSIRRPKSKEYFRIWAKDESGEYQYIDLNFSSI